MAVGPDAGLARAKAHSKAQLRKWGKEGGRPAKLDRMALARLESLLQQGKSQAKCARMLASMSALSGEEWRLSRQVAAPRRYRMPPVERFATGLLMAMITCLTAACFRILAEGYSRSVGFRLGLAMVAARRPL